MVPGRGEVGLWSPAGWLGRGGGPAVPHPGAAQRCVDARAPCQTHEVRRSGHLLSWSSGTTPAGGTGADGLFLQPRSLTRVAQKVGRGAPRGAVGLGSSPGTSVSVVLPPVSGAAWECTADAVIAVVWDAARWGVRLRPRLRPPPLAPSGRTGWGGGASLGRSGCGRAAPKGRRRASTRPGEEAAHRRAPTGRAPLPGPPKSAVLSSSCEKTHGLPVAPAK